MAAPPVAGTALVAVAVEPAGSAVETEPEPPPDDAKVGPALGASHGEPGLPCQRSTDPRANVDAARHHYQEGMTSFGKGDYRAAAAAFEIADCLRASHETRWRVARSYDLAGDECRALAWYRRCILEPKKNGPRIRPFELDAWERIAALEPRCR